MKAASALVLNSFPFFPYYYKNRLTLESALMESLEKVEEGD